MTFKEKKNWPINSALVFDLITGLLTKELFGYLDVKSYSVLWYVRNKGPHHDLYKNRQQNH